MTTPTVTDGFSVEDFNTESFDDFKAEEADDGTEVSTEVAIVVVVVVVVAWARSASEFSGLLQLSSTH